MKASRRGRPSAWTRSVLSSTGCAVFTISRQTVKGVSRRNRFIRSVVESAVGRFPRTSTPAGWDAGDPQRREFGWHPRRLENQHLGRQLLQRQLVAEPQVRAPADRAVGGEPPPFHVHAGVVLNGLLPDQWPQIEAARKHCRHLRSLTNSPEDRADLQRTP